MADSGLCNPAPGKPHYDHAGAGKVAGKPPGGSTVARVPENKAPQITGDNMSAANVGGMEHVQTGPPPASGHGPKKGPATPVSPSATKKGMPGNPFPGKGNP